MFRCVVGAMFVCLCVVGAVFVCLCVVEGSLCVSVCSGGRVFFICTVNLDVYSLFNLIKIFVIKLPQSPGQEARNKKQETGEKS